MEDRAVATPDGAGTVSVWRQTQAVLKKNLLLASRNKRDGFREFGVPLIMLIVLVIVANVSVNKSAGAELHPASTAVRELAAVEPTKELWFAPCVRGDASLADRLATAVQAASAGRVVKCYPCEASVVCGTDSLSYAYVQQPQDVLAAVVLGNGTAAGAAPASSSQPVTYRLRLDYKAYLPGSKGTVGVANFSSMYGSDGFYTAPEDGAASFTPAFLPLQRAVEAAIAVEHYGLDATAAASLSGGLVSPGAGGLPSFGGLSLRPFPWPAYEVSILSSALVFVVPIYFTLIFTLQVRVLLTRILEEKERKIAITLKMMGVSDTVYWSSWAVTALLKNTALVTIVVIIACTAGIFPRSNLGIVWLLFFLFELTCVSFSFALTPFFSNSKTGGALGMLVYLAAALPSYGLASGATPRGVKLLLALLAPCGFNTALGIVMRTETARQGATAANASDDDATQVGVSLAALMGMLAFDAVLYFAVAWYLGRVVPSEYGVPSHPLFCLGKRRAVAVAGAAGGREGLSRAGALVEAARANEVRIAAALAALSRGGEPVGAAPTSAATVAPTPALKQAFGAPEDMEAVPPEVASRPGIHVTSLCKVFMSRGGGALTADPNAPTTPAARRAQRAAAKAARKAGEAGLSGPRIAVDDLSLSLYEGQVTCLLGPNGAGKTTTIAMLTGLIPPTLGDAAVYGHSVVADTDAVRARMGVVPQYDILFEQLSVLEHLRLYGAIKGLNEPGLTARATGLLEELGLAEKTHTWAGKLSGGQKRRLSLAIALIGMPKVLLLDEPTSGLDPAARRAVWRVIQKYKAGRVIILTTHFMDEADILGDRIALIARGRLRVVGSPLFLKSRFGQGATLSVSLASGGSSELDAAAAELTRQVTAALPGVTRLGTGTSESLASASHAAASASSSSVVVFHVPQASLPRLADALDLLDDAKVAAAAGSANATGFVVSDYALEMASLEEVFVKLAKAIEAEVVGSGGGGAPAAPSCTETPAHTVLPVTEPPVSSSDPSASASEDDDETFRRWWWLDIRRRALTHPDEAAAVAGADAFSKRLRATLPPADYCYQRGTVRFMLHQVAVHISRRWKQLRHDPRSVWLQCVTPVIFVAASVVFRLLRGVGVPATAGISPLTAAGFDDALRGVGTPGNFSLPYAFAAGAGTSSAGVFASSLLSAAGVAGAWPLPVNVTGAPVPTLLSSVATPAALDDAISASFGHAGGAWAAGALLLQAAPASLTLAFNQTLVNGIPTLVSLWNSVATSALLLAGARSGGAPTAALPVPLWRGWAEPLPSLPAGAAAAGPSAFPPPTDAYLSTALTGLYVGLGFITIPAIQAAGIVFERESRAKSMQLLLGSSLGSYWLGAYLWDAVLLFLAPFAGATLVIGLAYGDTYFNGAHLAAVALCILFYGVAMTAPTYVASFAFKTSHVAQMIIRMGASLLLLITFGVTFALDFPDLLPADAGAALARVADSATALQHIFMLFPPYALAKAFPDVGAKTLCPASLTQAGIPCTRGSPWTWSAAGGKLAYLLGSIPLWWGVLIYLERRSQTRTGGGGGLDAATAAAPRDDDAELEDSDVLAAKSRIRAELVEGSEAAASASPEATSGLLVAALRKVFTSKGTGKAGKVAVADLSFAVAPGEVFGLLGPNGAGKTTSISMLVGEAGPDRGAIRVSGVGIGVARSGGADLIGFVPQFDALFETMTPAEHLSYYARLNGVADAHVHLLVNAALDALGLQTHRSKQARFLSGGNRRRLSLALAYVGSPRAVFLDEVSTGVDPAARRRLFDVIDRGRAGRVTVMTTHVLEEADGLCSRIGIMVGGRLACFGTPAHLKARYGRGYVVDVLLGGGGAAGATADAGAAHAATAAVTAALEGAASGAAECVRLAEVNQGHLRFEMAATLPDGMPLRVGRVFRTLDGLRASGVVAAFTFGQSSLETVFLGFSSRQERLNQAAGAAGSKAH